MTMAVSRKHSPKQISIDSTELLVETKANIRNNLKTEENIQENNSKQIPQGSHHPLPENKPLLIKRRPYSGSSILKNSDRPSSGHSVKFIENDIINADSKETFPAIQNGTSLTSKQKRSTSLESITFFSEVQNSSKMKEPSQTNEILNGSQVSLNKVTKTEGSQSGDVSSEEMNNENDAPSSHFVSFEKMSNNKIFAKELDRQITSNIPHAQNLENIGATHKILKEFQEKSNIIKERPVNGNTPGKELSSRPVSAAIDNKTSIAKKILTNQKSKEESKIKASDMEVVTENSVLEKDTEGSRKAHESRVMSSGIKDNTTCESETLCQETPTTAITSQIRSNRRSTKTQSKRRKRIYNTDFFPNDGEINRLGFLSGTTEDTEKRHSRHKELKRRMSDFNASRVDVNIDKPEHSKSSGILKIQDDSAKLSDPPSSPIQKQNAKKKKKLRELYEELKRVRQAIASMYSSVIEDQNDDAPTTSEEELDFADIEQNTDSDIPTNTRQNTESITAHKDTDDSTHTAYTEDVTETVGTDEPRHNLYTEDKTKTVDTDESTHTVYTEDMTETVDTDESNKNSYNEDMTKSVDTDDSPCHVHNEDVNKTVNTHESTHTENMTKTSETGHYENKIDIDDIAKNDDDTQNYDSSENNDLMPNVDVKDLIKDTSTDCTIDSADNADSISHNISSKSSLDGASQKAESHTCIETVDKKCSTQTYDPGVDSKNIIYGEFSERIYQSDNNTNISGTSDDRQSDSILDKSKRNSIIYGETFDTKGNNNGNGFKENLSAVSTRSYDLSNVPCSDKTRENGFRTDDSRVERVKDEVKDGEINPYYEHMNIFNVKETLIKGKTVVSFEENDPECSSVPERKNSPGSCNEIVSNTEEIHHTNDKGECRLNDDLEENTETVKDAFTYEECDKKYNSNEYPKIRINEENDCTENCSSVNDNGFQQFIQSDKCQSENGSTEIHKVFQSNDDGKESSLRETQNDDNIETCDSNERNFSSFESTQKNNGNHFESNENAKNVEEMYTPSISTILVQNLGESENIDETRNGRDIEERHVRNIANDDIMNRETDDNASHLTTLHINKQGKHNDAKEQSISFCLNEEEVPQDEEKEHTIKFSLKDDVCDADMKSGSEEIDLKMEAQQERPVIIPWKVEENKVDGVGECFSENDVTLLESPSKGKDSDFFDECLSDNDSFDDNEEVYKDGSHIVLKLLDEFIEEVVETHEKRKSTREFKTIVSGQEEISCIVFCDPENGDDVRRMRGVCCVNVDPLTVPSNTGKYEFIVSSIIQLTCSNDTTFKGSTVKIRLPFVKSEMKYYQCPILRKLDADRIWHDITSVEYLYEDDDGCVMPILEADLEGPGIFAIVACPVKEQFMFGRHVREVSSVIDRETVLTGAFCPRFQTTETVANLTVIPIERYVIDDSKCPEIEDSSLLVSTSSLVIVELLNDPPQPITLYLLCSKPKSRPWTAQMTSRLGTAESGYLSGSRIVSRAKSRESINNFLECWYEADNYLVRMGGGCLGVKSTQICKKDLTKDDKMQVTLHEKHNVYLIVEMRKEARRPDVNSVVCNLLKTMKEHRIYVCVAQKRDKPNQLRVTCDLKSKVTTRMVNKLEREYFIRRSLVCAKEGDVISIGVRGNIVTVPNRKRIFRFYALNGIVAEWDIKVVDPYCQRSLSNYCGFVEVCVCTDDSFEGGQVSGYEESIPWRLLSEVIVTLPKNSSHLQFQGLSHAPLLLRHKGPITIEFLKSLARFIGKEWYHLARSLELDHVRVQSIAQQNRRSSMESLVQDIFTTWLKRSLHCKDKAYLLSRALRRCGRFDLAEEVNDIDRAYKRDIYQTINDRRLEKAIILASSSRVIIKTWKDFGKCLQLSEGDLQGIDAMKTSEYNKCHKMFVTWKDREKQHQGPNKLIKILRQAGFPYVAVSRGQRRTNFN